MVQMMLNLNDMMQAEGMENLVSELARMAGGEKALTEECGYLLSKAYSSQLNECSLRGALMQLNHPKTTEELAASSVMAKDDLQLILYKGEEGRKLKKKGASTESVGK